MRADGVPPPTRGRRWCIRTCYFSYEGTSEIQMWHSAATFASLRAGGRGSLRRPRGCDVLAEKLTRLFHRGLHDLLLRPRTAGVVSKGIYAFLELLEMGGSGGLPVMRGRIGCGLRLGATPALLQGFDGEEAARQWPAAGGFLVSR